MKKIMYVVMAVFISLPVFSQKTKVEESVENIAGGKNNALVVWIPESNRKAVVKEWSALMKKNKASVKSKKEVFADDAILPQISSNTIDVYAIAEQRKSDVKLIVAFDLGGAFLSSKSHESQYKVAEKMVYDFAVEMAKQNVQNLIAAEKKKMSDIEKRRKKLESDIASRQKGNDKMRKQIESNEKVISENKKTIESFNNDIKNSKSRIETLEKKYKAVD